MPNTLQATFRIVTPMFIGGADQNPADGIRPPSVKGALRFWWRALNWHQVRAAATDDASALKNLHEKEAWLFGHAAGDNNSGGQGQFLLRVTKQPKLTQILSDWPKNNTGAGYMAYGILESGSHSKGNFQPHRKAIDEKEKQEFTIEIKFKPRVSEEHIAQLTKTLEIFGQCGGLGSRARRGMGSVSLVKLNEKNCLLTQDEYTAVMNSLLNELQPITMPPFTAFSSQTRFRLLIQPSNDARSIVAKSGQLFKDHRGQASTLRGKAKIPFGLPLQGIDEKSRRASPLFFHVQALKDAQFVGTVLYLPAMPFHPKYQTINYGVVSDFAKSKSI